MWQLRMRGFEIAQRVLQMRRLMPISHRRHRQDKTVLLVLSVSAVWNRHDKSPVKPPLYKFSHEARMPLKIPATRRSDLATSQSVVQPRMRTVANAMKLHSLHRTIFTIANGARSPT